MPEGDAVRRTCRRLHDALAGHVVTDWQLRWPSVAGSDERGRTTLEVVSRGKHILHRLDDGVTLHTHLRMDGAWRIKEPAKVTRADVGTHPLRALVGCRTATALGYQLGMMDVLPTEREGDVVGHLGPDLLGEEFDAATAAANLLTQPERDIGAALLDQRNLAGIGTIWDAETLFLERVHPWTPVAELGEERVAGIVARARALLLGAMAFEWSVSTGDPSAPTFAHSRDGRPCRICRTTMRVDYVGEPPQHRVMYWCPGCQPGPVPEVPPGVRPPRRRDRGAGA